MLLHQFMLLRQDLASRTYTGRNGNKKHLEIKKNDGPSNDL